MNTFQLPEDILFELSELIHKASPMGYHKSLKEVLMSYLKSSPIQTDSYEFQYQMSDFHALLSFFEKVDKIEVDNKKE